MIFTAIGFVTLVTLKPGAEDVLVVMAFIAATKVAVYVNSWINRKIGDIEYKWDHEEEFIFIGKAIICFIAAVIAALIAAVVSLLLLYALFEYMPIVNLTS